MTQRKKRRATPLSWYGVKTVFRTAASGKPLAKDSAYDPNMTGIEERIVLYRARSFGQAIRAALKEARVYARDRHTNPYGQRVVTRLLSGCDAFQLFDPPRQGKEIFSTTEVVSKRVSDKVIVAQHLGHVETAREHRSRRNILNREFSGNAKRGV